MTTGSDEPSAVFHPGALNERPGLAKYVNTVISTWAWIDCTFINLASNFLKSEHVAVASMLETIINPTTRYSAISALAESTLTVDEYDLYHASKEAIFEGSGKEIRNKFTHHLWGYDARRDDTLLLLDPRHWTQSYAIDNADRERRKKDRNAPFSQTPLQRSDVFHKYREDELISLANDALDRQELANDLHFAFIPGHPASRVLRQKLEANPKIKVRLVKRKRKRS
ncbi:hypothetical protein [Roseibium sp. SCP14]|uniref:hypothetical protein n=1 Tax=Roseibium sp. SCP14 TaxID=3141375 RepID=UPI00333C2E6E